MSNRYDRLSHNVFSHLFAFRELMRTFLSPERFQSLNWKTLKSERNQLRTRIADGVFSLSVKKEFLKQDNASFLKILEVFFLFEHKSFFTKKVFKQLHRYFKLLEEVLGRDGRHGRIQGGGVISWNRVLAGGCRIQGPVV